MLIFTQPASCPVTEQAAHLNLDSKHGWGRGLGGGFAAPASLRTCFNRMCLYPTHVHVMRKVQRGNSRARVSTACGVIGWLEWRGCPEIQPVLDGCVPIRPRITSRTVMVHARHVLGKLIGAGIAGIIARHISRVISPIDAVLTLVHKY